MVFLSEFLSSTYAASNIIDKAFFFFLLFSPFLLILIYLLCTLESISPSANFKKQNSWVAQVNKSTEDRVYFGLIPLSFSKISHLSLNILNFPTIVNSVESRNKYSLK